VDIVFAMKTWLHRPRMDNNGRKLIESSPHTNSSVGLVKDQERDTGIAKAVVTRTDGTLGCHTVVPGMCMFLLYFLGLIIRLLSVSLSGIAIIGALV